MSDALPVAADDRDAALVHFARSITPAEAAVLRQSLSALAVAVTVAATPVSLFLLP